MSKPITHHSSAASPLNPAVMSVYLVASAWLVLPGCDETAAPRTSDVSLDGKQDGKDRVAPEAVGGAATTSRVQAIAGYDRCYRECFTARTSATNRETCKLDCDGLAEDGLGASADPAAREAYRHLRGCITDCWEDPKLSATNRETCLLTCTDDAVVAVTAPPKQTLEVVPGTVLAPDAELPPGVRPAPSGAK